MPYGTFGSSRRYNGNSPDDSDAQSGSSIDLVDPSPLVVAVVHASNQLLVRLYAGSCVKVVITVVTAVTEVFTLIFKTPFILFVGCNRNSSGRKHLVPILNSCATR